VLQTGIIETGRKMRRISFTLSVALLSSVAVAAASGLPPEVADRLENSISLDEANDFVGTYRISISSVVQKPNGKSREESLIEANVIHRSDGTTQRSLLTYIEDGTDVTEKKRTKFESEGGGREKDDDEDDDLADPFGDAADRYRFGAVKSSGLTDVITFEPAQGHEDDDDIARGAIAWDATSLVPRWLEMDAVHPPKPLKELRLRMEFVEIDDDLYVSQLLTDGLAKILLLKREFHAEIRFDDISPAKKPIESAQ